MGASYVKFVVGVFYKKLLETYGNLKFLFLESSMVHLTSMEESYMIDNVNNSTCLVTSCTFGEGLHCVFFEVLNNTVLSLEIVMPTLSNHSMTFAYKYS